LILSKARTCSVSALISPFRGDSFIGTVLPSLQTFTRQYLPVAPSLALSIVDREETIVPRHHFPSSWIRTHTVSRVLNSYGQGWSRSSGPEQVASIPSPLSGLVSDDSGLVRAALATFVALILDCTLRSEVVEGISGGRH